MKVKNLLTKHQRWCKEYFAVDNMGNSVNCEFTRLPNKPKACRFCLDGALIYCYGQYTEEYYEAARKVKSTVQTLYPQFDDDYVSFNDDPSTSFKKVQRVLRAADV